MSNSSASAAPDRPIWKGVGFQIVVAMALGAVLGLLFPSVAVQFKILGDIFLRLVKTATAPLVFLCIATGIVSAGDFRRVGRVGVIALLYFGVLSTLALVLGLAAANLLGVGRGMGAAVAAAHAARPPAPSAQDFVLNVFPDSFIGAFANGDLLQVLVIGILCGAAILRLGPDRRAPVERGLNRVCGVLFELIHVVMALAPVGAFGTVAYAVGASGSTVIWSVLHLVLAFYAVVALFVVVVLGGVCAACGLNLFRLMRDIREDIAIVLGTASSSSVLPRLLEKLPRLGASNECVGLVLPAGYAFNQGGTCLYMSMAVVFLANAYGAPLDIGQQIGVLGVMMLTTKGVATVSGGALVMLAATVSASGALPAEGLPILFGAHRFLSVGIATCNVIGASVAAVVVAKLSGEFDAGRARAADLFERLGPVDGPAS